MCIRCEGFSEEDVRRSIELNIITHGWHVTGVVPSEGEKSPSWAYTIGLEENFGLPELIIMDIDFSAGHRLLNGVAKELIGGAGLAEFDRVGVKHGAVHDEWVCTTHLLNGWIDYYERMPAGESFLQVFAPLSWFCWSHGKATDLSTAESISESWRY